MLVRKNQKFMTTAERNRFICAYQAMRAGFLEGVDKPRLLEFVHEHHHAFAEHRDTTHGTMFFAWHRALLRGFELRLRKEDPSVTIPFWNPFEDDYPAWLLEVPNVSRERDPGVVRKDLTAIPYHITDFEDFQDEINRGFHTQVHAQLGGAMANPHQASGDPVFWLHHGNVDRIWSLWTENYWSAEPGVNGNAEYRPATHDQLLPPSHEDGILSTRDINKLNFSVNCGYAFGSGLYNDLERTGASAFAVRLAPGQILSFDTGTWQAKVRVVSMTREAATLDVRLYGNWKPVRDYKMRVEDSGYFSLIKNGLSVARSLADLQISQSSGTSISYVLSTINGTRAAVYEGSEPYERLTP